MIRGFDLRQCRCERNAEVVLKLTNIRLPVNESEDRLRDYCSRRLRVPSSAITGLRILRKSLDVRNKRRLEHVFTAAVALEDEAAVAKRRIPTVSAYVPTPFQPPSPGPQVLRERPVIVGAGPAGLLCAYQLAELGYFPLVLERGKSVRDRTRDVREFDRGGAFDPESNYLFGEGGAGTFSDGKLTCRNTGSDTDRVLEIFAECKGGPSIQYEARPHLGSNRLPAVVKALRRRIVEMGGEIRFQCRVDELVVQSGRVVGVETTGGRLPCEVLVLAVGHSARDTIEMLRRARLPIEFKPFQAGLRIEQPQSTVTRVQYGMGPLAACLGPADYTMKVEAEGREVFTFCMCAGGYVIASASQPGYLCTNGMSRSFHESPYANSGVVTTIDADDLECMGFGRDALSGVRFQEACERKGYVLGGGGWQAPIQRPEDFAANRASRGPLASSYARGVRPANLREVLPPEVARRLMEGLSAMDARWRGDFLRDATLVGPESRGSCPIRMTRDPVGRESLGIGGVYPIGEGAGFAGGIVSAAVDGLRTACAIVRRCQPFRK
jgi:uncharacterized FAD-dependent dehydrogenase